MALPWLRFTVMMLSPWAAPLLLPWRHYSATELVTAGVDIRTVAGRIGHGGGGTTTLRVYAAWVPESDKRAASLLAQRMPRPGRPTDS